MDQHYSGQTEHLFDDEKPLVYASFWDRCAAYLIDILILTVPQMLMLTALPEAAYRTGSIIIAWLYFAIQESSAAQATFGKKSLGLKVVSSTGERINFGQATGRHFGKFISALILLIGFFMVLWDEKRRALHDMMASTLVVKP